MKITFLFFTSTVSLLLFTGCKQVSTSTENTVNGSGIIQEEEKVYSIPELLSEAEMNIDKTIRVKGIVSHVCKHAGKKCFLTGDSTDITLRVESGGNINGFNRELKGSEIVVSGILRQNKFDEDFIRNWEEKVNEEKKSGKKNSSHCESELTSISKMREWMKKNNRDYYSVYFINGIDFQVIE